MFFLPWSRATGGYSDPVFFSKTILLVVFTLASLLIFLFQAVQEGRIKLRRTPFDFFIVAFLLFYTLAFAFSRDKYISLFHWLVVLCLGVFYFLVVNVMERREKLLTCFMGSLAAVGAMFLISLFLPFVRTALGGILNPLGNQTNLIAFMAVGAVIAQTLLIRREIGEIFNKGNGGDKGDNIIREIGGIRGKIKTAGCFLCLAIFLAVIAIVNFRLGLILLAGGSLVLVSLVMAKAAAFDLKKKWLVLPLLIALASLFAIFLNAPPIYNAKLPVEASLSQNISLKTAFQESVKNIFGAGPGNFSIAYARYKPEVIAQDFLWQTRFNQASSQFAEVLSSSGFPGLAAFLALSLLAAVVFFLRGRWLPAMLILLAVCWYLSFNTVWWLLFFTLLAVDAPRKDGKLFEFSLKKSSNGMFTLSLLFVAILVLVIFFVSFIGKIYLADYYFNKGDINNALRYNPKEPAYYTIQADKVFAQAVAAVGLADKTQALTLAGQALNYTKVAFDLSPNNVAVCEKRALLLEQARSFVTGSGDWAARTYQACIVLEPANPLFYQQLGISLDMQGDSEKAIGELKEAVRLRPQLSTAQYELGRMYYNAGDMAKSEESFREAVLYSPDYANALYGLALVYQKQGKKAEAVLLLKRVLQLNPNAEAVRAKIIELGG